MIRTVKMFFDSWEHVLQQGWVLRFAYHQLSKSPDAEAGVEAVGAITLLLKATRLLV